MIAEAKIKIPVAEISRVSYYEIPYPEESFNYVVATNALSGVHIDAKKVLMEMTRVCRIGRWVFIAEWPEAEIDTFEERCVVWFARLTDDAPKDYLRMFRDMGYEPKVDVLDKRYHVYGVRK
ncbi:MAG: methyltransferase domain-containing protein [Anaerolineales bacterium]|nr:methyltransferase domain-containing protein [Anaerolineales bacterium]